MGKLLSSKIISGTESFRWSAGLNPKGLGFNDQTAPKGVRHFFLAPPGRILIQPDLSQAEARLVAYFSSCRGLIELFNDPTRSVHLENALRIFGHSVEKDSPEYTLAKSIVHASNYREGPRRFSQQTGIPVKEAKVLLEKYHSVYPEIRTWHDEIKREFETRGFLESPLGRKRVFYEALAMRSLTGKISDQMWKEMISWKPQTTVPDITNRAMLNLSQNLEYSGLWWHQQGHDSFVGSVPIAELPQYARAVVMELAQPIPIKGRIMVIPTEVQVGYNWGEMINYEPTMGVVTYEGWLKLVEKKQQKRDEILLRGMYGPLLKDVYEERKR